ncbi:cytochrome c oxidase accessory protein CcoG [Thalassotalea piscium]
MKSSYLSKENLIYKSTAAKDKIYIREQHGKYQRIRRSLNMLLLALFIIAPLLKYKGMQAIYFDLQQQQFHLFSVTLFPQDLLLVCFILVIAAFLLFYATKFFGRIWCGFTCPQTVWMLMFNWVERRVEGSHNHSKSLDLEKLSATKVVKKTIKHAIWMSIALLTSLVFISYFVPVEELYVPFFTLNASSLVTSWVLFFSLCTYINAGWIREKMCLHMCPYARFQSAMFDSSTKLVSYDRIRGENRGKRKLSQVKEEGMGDCVDCNLCVQVCPVGIDIRNGLQYECINCGLCIDACDTTMSKFNYDKGLIAFTSEQKPKNRLRRHSIYGGFTLLAIIAMTVWLQTWKSFDVSIIRDRQALYRVNQAGHIENTYVFKIRNKSNQSTRYKIAVEGLDNANIIGQEYVEVMPLELKTFSLAVEVNKLLPETHNDIGFKIISEDDKSSLLKNTSFYSGKGGW